MPETTEKKGIEKCIIFFNVITKTKNQESKGPRIEPISQLNLIIIGSVEIIFDSDSLHVDKYIQGQYIQDLTVSFKLICKPFIDTKCMYNICE